MILVAQARKMIAARCRPLGAVVRPIDQALGAVLAETVRAPIPLPLWDNTAMDGFVVRSRDTQRAAPGNAVRLRIRGVIRAGDSRSPVLKPGEAYQIMTGAMIPRGGDAVIPVEDARAARNELVVTRPVRRGKHIRRRGEEVRRGERMLEPGTRLHAGAIGSLATLGVKTASVYRLPKVAVIATGSELTAPGRPLRPGRIYDSNSRMIGAALRQMGLAPQWTTVVPDETGRVRRAVQKALRGCDVTILIGGVSVGEYDFVKDVLGECGVQQVFWKVAQKPGKPLYFGAQGRKLIFGLPGNPASAFIGFYEYVWPALRQLAGARNPSLPREWLPITHRVKVDATKEVFLKARVRSKPNGRTVEPLPYQGSHMISVLPQANALIVIAPGRGMLRRGTRVPVDLLPVDRGEGG